MIEILKMGTKKRIECEACGALLRYEEEDVKEDDTCLNGITIYINKYIICPQCDEKIILEATR